MNMRELLVLLNDFVEDNINSIIIAIIILINIIGFFATNTNTYQAYLFYPNKHKDKLIAEKRDIVRKFSKKERIKATVEELLLGNINPEINNLIPNNARILNVELNGKNVILNFNEETVMNIDTVKSNNPSLYYKLVLQSIIDSIKFQFKDVDKIYFYFNGKLYNYLDTYGPLENGIKIDYNLLKK